MSKYSKFIRAYEKHVPSKFVVKGDIELHATKCSNCGNITCIKETVQLRSNDEESSEVVKCLVCDK